VNWRHKIAVVVLAVLAALPLAGVICAMTCVSASTAVAAHHGDGQDCEQAMTSSPAGAASDAASSDAASSEAASSDAAAAVRIGTLSDVDCGHHEGTLPQVAATAPPRADLAVIAAHAASDPVHPLFGSLTALDSVFHYTPPRDSAPSTTMPLVLRV
jgi:hypothetical protein